MANCSFWVGQDGATALELRPNSEYRDLDLPPDSPDARICTYECTFCASVPTPTTYSAARTSAPARPRQADPPQRRRGIDSLSAISRARCSGVLQALLETARPAEGGSYLLLDGNRVEAIVSDAVRCIEAAERSGRTPVLVCSPQVRAPVRRLIGPTLPRLAVLSYNEVPAGLTIDALGVVTGAPAAVGR